MMWILKEKIFRVKIGKGFCELETLSSLALDYLREHSHQNTKIFGVMFDQTKEMPD
jgi:hypothetical protein